MRRHRALGWGGASLAASPAGAFYPDQMGLGLYGFHGAQFMKNMPPADKLTTISIWWIVPFVLVFVSVIAATIWLVVTDERADARKREDEQRARKLKFGRMDPRYNSEHAD